MTTSEVLAQRARVPRSQSRGRESGAARTQAFLDVGRVPLHLAAEGGVAVLTAVLDDAQHLELDVHRVLLEALEQEIFQLQTRVDRGVCDARNLVEHVARRGFGGVGSGLGDEGFVHGWRRADHAEACFVRRDVSVRPALRDLRREIDSPLGTFAPGGDCLL